jgi:hypothetical protein
MEVHIIMIDIKVGMVLYGYCNGYFGRENYEDKIVEGFGRDWIVARDINGGACFASFSSTYHMVKCIDNWIKEQ